MRETAETRRVAIEEATALRSGIENEFAAIRASAQEAADAAILHAQHQAETIRQSAVPPVAPTPAPTPDDPSDPARLAVPTDLSGLVPTPDETVAPPEMALAGASRRRFRLFRRRSS